jgi:hypothetical protein
MGYHSFRLGLPELIIILTAVLFLFAPYGIKQLGGLPRRLEYLLIPAILILWIILARLGGLI